MADLFETVKIDWGGKHYEVMPTLELVCRVENVITATELYGFLERGAYPFAKLSMAFGIILRFASCPVTDHEVYQAMFSDSEDQNAPAASVSALLSMMAPKTQDEGTKKPSPPKDETS